MSATIEHFRWLTGDDHGISSETIWAVMTGERPGNAGWHPNRPLDGDDLGRCVRLIARFPEWRPRLHEVAEHYRDWAPIISRWGEAEAAVARGAKAAEAFMVEAYRGRCACGGFEITEPHPNGEKHRRNGCRWRPVP